MSLSKKYKKSSDLNWSMRFKTIHPEGDTYDGVITHNKRNHVVLCVVNDFEFDGFMIFPKRMIKGYRDSRFELCSNRIMTQNGTIGSIQYLDWLDGCASIVEVLKELKEHDIWLAVEILIDKGRDSAFYLGPIIEISEKDFSIHCYDAVGNWDKIYWIEFDKILRVEFNSRYCNHFNAYMRSHALVPDSNSPRR